MSKTPAEYRAERRATVECPGGLVVHLQKFEPVEVLLQFDMQPAFVAMVRAARASGEDLEQMTPQLLAEHRKDYYALACAFVCAASNAARAVGRPGPYLVMDTTDEDDEVCVRELDPMDVDALSAPTLKWFGTDKEGLAIIAPFRDEADAAGESAGAGLSAE